MGISARIVETMENAIHTTIIATPITVDCAAWNRTDGPLLFQQQEEDAGQGHEQVRQRAGHVGLETRAGSRRFAGGGKLGHADRLRRKRRNEGGSGAGVGASPSDGRSRCSDAISGWPPRWRRWGSPVPTTRRPSTRAPRIITVTEPVPLTIETYRLANGLNVILSRDTSVPVVAVNLWYHVGSGDERPGRTGFAHLFEHMMFQGSQNVGDDEHFRLIQEAGGTLNGSTNSDRTNYFQAVPSNFLERVLWQEADRMGFLLPAMTQEKLDNQRSVVQNERRQNYDNAPYGLAFETLAAALYPEGHPYSWTTIGSLEDLNAASLEDVQDFFRTYYAPATLAGHRRRLRPGAGEGWVERYFGPISRGPHRSSGPTRSRCGWTRSGAWCWRTGCSSRASTSPGPPPRSTSRATRTSTPWPTSWPAAGARGCTSGWWHRSRSRSS
jgi:hypothetical protein